MNILILVIKKRILIKDKKLKDLFKKGGRKGSKRDFFELVKRASGKIITLM
jgi:hypothetical protein